MKFIIICTKKSQILIIQIDCTASKYEKKIQLQCLKYLVKM